MGDDHGEKEKLSWSELDKRRGRPRSANAGHPGGRQAQVRAEREKRDALKAADALFAGEPGGETGAALARAVRDAHGSSDLVQACREYMAALGAPRSEDLLSIFLDAGDAALVIAALEQLEALQHDNGRLEMRDGLKRQLRALMEHPDDEIAGRSEDLLDQRS